MDITIESPYLRAKTLDENGNQQVEQYVIPKRHKSYEI